MSRSGGRLLLITAGLTALSGEVQASAWSQPKGHGQVIVKIEAIEADRAMDVHGDRYDLLDGRRDGVGSILLEYGLTDRLTLQAKAEWQSGREGEKDFDGKGPMEIGARWRLYQDDVNVLAVYAGYTQAGETRNAGYAAPGQGDHDFEYRLLAGRVGDKTFTEVQLAQRLRDGLPDETRMDLTTGYHLSPKWTLMGQLYMGVSERNDQGYRAQWATSDFSVVRHFGDWSGQVAWRESLNGRSTPDSHGLVMAIWRRF